MAPSKTYDPGAAAFTVRLPADLHKWLQDEARERLVSVNFIVAGAVERLRDEQEGEQP